MRRGGVVNEPGPGLPAGWPLVPPRLLPVGGGYGIVYPLSQATQCGEAPASVTCEPRGARDVALCGVCGIRVSGAEARGSPPRMQSPESITAA